LGAITNKLVLKLWLACVLTVASATVWAQPVQPVATVPVATSTATDQAQAAVASAAAPVSQLAGQRAKLKAHYDDQLATNERLKNERPSWRRDRELRASLADSQDTAKSLESVSTQLTTATASLDQARRAYAKAIDAELAAGATGARGGQLARARADLDAKLGGRPKKIVMPDDVQIDQLDPEDLEQQDQIIADTEKQLANQVAGLDQQASELARVAELRKSHERANDMMIREDDQPHRDVQHSTSATGGITAAAPVANGAAQGGGDEFSGGGGAPTGGDRNSSFETEATFVLGEVIDPSTLDSLARASRSGDPAKRAAAARAARDAVAARLEQLKKKRTQIEQREKQLRGH
jgi:hypothetical protein